MIKDFKNNRYSIGFTLIELLIAMALLGFFLLIVSVGVLQVVKIYRSSLSARLVQNNARLAMEEITRLTRAASTLEVIDSSHMFCLGDTTSFRFRITVINEHLVIQEAGSADTTDCVNGVFTNTKELTNETVVVDAGTGFNVVDNGKGSATVILTVRTIHDDLFDITNQVCRPGPGSEYCATTTLSTTISVREKADG